MNNLLPFQYDGVGLYGSLLHYGLIIFFVGAAFIIFLHLWRKGRLDMDEEPKLQMMRSDQENSEEPYDKSPRQ